MSRKYLPLQQAYMELYGRTPTQQTLLRKRTKGLDMVFISGEWLTTLEAVESHEREITASKGHKPLLASAPKTRSEAKRAKAIADASKTLEASGI
jgi:hypothetical protein